MASTIFLGNLKGHQKARKGKDVNAYMRMESMISNKGIAPMIAKGNIIEGIEAKE